MSKLIDQVIRQRGEKIAARMHTAIILAAFKTSTDERINSEDARRYDDIKVAITDAAIKELNRLKTI